MNPLIFLKYKYKNLYIILVSLLIAVWFNSIYRILNSIIPSNAPLYIPIIMCIFVIFIFYADNRLIDELYRYDIVYPISASNNMPRIRGKMR